MKPSKPTNTLILFLLSILFLPVSSPKVLTEQNLAEVQLTVKDLPDGFVKSDDNAIQDLKEYTDRLQGVFFINPASGETIHPVMFTKETINANYGIVSFGYFPLSTEEKQRLSALTQKRDVATCCEMISAFMGGSENTCKNTDFVSLISVLSSVHQVGEESLGCSINIQGNSYNEIGYFIRQNFVAVIFDGYAQYYPADVINPVLDLNHILMQMNDKLTAAGF